MKYQGYKVSGAEPGRGGLAVVQMLQPLQVAESKGGKETF